MQNYEVELIALLSLLNLKSQLLIYVYIYFDYSYATANLMYYTQSGTKDNTKLYMEAARKGRSQQDCKQLYSMCNEIA